MAFNLIQLDLAQLNEAKLMENLNPIQKEIVVIKDRIEYFDNNVLHFMR